MGTTSSQWWNQLNIFIHILSLITNFFFKTVAFEFKDQRLCIGTWLIRSESMQVIYIGFQFFFGYSSLFHFVKDGFFQVLHLFIFVFFHTWRDEAWSSRVCVKVICSFFSKSLLTVSVTANLSSKNIICPSSVLTFFC